MRVMEEDLKKGVVKVFIQSKEDCWHLYNIIEKGDIVSAHTYRSMEKDDKIRSKKEKEKVYIKIKVTDLEFQEFTDRLRIRGIILEGVESIGAYHTFNIEPNMEIKIEKEWKEYHIKRLKEAQKKHGKIAIVAMDDEVATIAIVHEYGVEEIANIHSNYSGKMYEGKEDKKEYYGQILSKIKNLELPIAIVGPGFEKENFIKFAKKDLKKYVVDSVSYSGMAGINEAIRRGIIEKIMEENKVANETKIVEELLKEIAKDGSIAYGKEEVKKAIEMGAVKELVILNKMIRSEEKLVKMAEEMGAKISIINEMHDAGKKLEALGGIAAFLRYPIKQAL